jgi:hypothetical protein
LVKTAAVADGDERDTHKLLERLALFHASAAHWAHAHATERAAAVGCLAEDTRAEGPTALELGERGRPRLAGRRPRSRGEVEGRSCRRRRHPKQDRPEGSR